jgi:16S rRNA (uracil1498-N3)-methyltransferase
MKTGDRLGILNGNGDTFECEIIDENPKKCALKIVDFNHKPELNHTIHIAVGPTKQMERIEWFIEKATEIGITEISLVRCKNSERIKIKPDRLEKKAVSAMKQSHRKYLPKINELVDVKDFIKNHPNGLIAHCYENADRDNLQNAFRKNNCPILIGPEGDFTEDEIAFALQNGYKTITLGENRLRTETAALYACMLAKSIVS